MVKPGLRDELETKLELWGIPNEEIISNLGELIAQTSPREITANRDVLSNGTLSAQLLSSNRFYKQFHPYDEIEAKLQDLAYTDPRVTLSTIARSSEGRNIYLVKVSSDAASNKPVILMDAGHHAREVS